MQHQGTVSIETKRLILRKFRIEDSEAAFKNWTNDEQVTKFLRWPAHPNVETTKTIINMWIQDYQNDNFYQWAICLKEKENEPIGSISAFDANEELSKIHIGYCIGRNWWNMGIVTEAFQAIIPFLIEQVKVNRIESTHDPLNPGSGKVMQKCGLIYEGTLRQADISNQGITDSAVYSILASEYYANLKEDTIK